MIRISSNWKSIDRELDRLGKAPNKAAMLLDEVLDKGFKLTQAEVHVITGSLKSSGKKSSHADDDSWEGNISYGGASAGVNNPVTYAIYEKARDADHDFMSPLQSLDNLYVKAMLKAMS